MSKSEVIKFLITLIEESIDTNTRIESIHVICDLNLKSTELFRILEKCLISDESVEVRAAAAICIMKNFIDQGLEALKWAIKYDNSVTMVKTLRNLKSILEQEFS